jgi:hypothetical protein
MPAGRLEEIKVLHTQTQTSISHITYEHDANGFVERRTEHVEGRDEDLGLIGIPGSLASSVARPRWPPSTWVLPW